MAMPEWFLNYQEGISLNTQSNPNPLLSKSSPIPAPSKENKVGLAESLADCLL